MPKHNFLAGNEVIRAANAAAAGTGDVNSDRVSAANCSGITFLALLGAVATSGVPSIKVQGTNDEGASYDDLEGTSITATDTDDNKILAIEIEEPTYTEYRLVIGRATANVTLDGVLAIRHARRVQPVEHGDTVAGSEIHQDPGSGTP